LTKPVCYFLVGAPYMGKSHYVENDSVLKTLPVVSSDLELLKLCDKEGIAYHEGFGRLFMQAKDAMNRRLSQVIRDRVDFVYDRTNLTVQGRSLMIRRLKDAGYSIRCLNFGVPVTQEEKELAASRRKTRLRQIIPEDVFASMCGQFVPPTVAEGFDEVREIRMIP